MSTMLSNNFCFPICIKIEVICPKLFLQTISDKDSIKCVSIKYYHFNNFLNQNAILKSYFCSSSSFSFSDNFFLASIVPLLVNMCPKNLIPNIPKSVSKGRQQVY